MSEYFVKTKEEEEKQEEEVKKLGNRTLFSFEVNATCREKNTTRKKYLKPKSTQDFFCSRRNHTFSLSQAVNSIILLQIFSLNLCLKWFKTKRLLSCLLLLFYFLAGGYLIIFE